MSEGLASERRRNRLRHLKANQPESKVGQAVSPAAKLYIQHNSLGDYSNR
jgi:hypothetical protein